MEALWAEAFEKTLKTRCFGSFCDPPGIPRRVVLNSSFTGIAVWPVRLNPGALAVVGSWPGARPGVKSSQTIVFSKVFGTPRATQPSNHLGNTMVWSVFKHFRYLRATPDASGEAWGSPAPRTLPARLNPEQRVERYNPKPKPGSSGIQGFRAPWGVPGGPRTVLWRSCSLLGPRWPPRALQEPPRALQEAPGVRCWSILVDFLLNFCACSVDVLVE